MAVQQPTNGQNKRLALIKAVKIDLNKQLDNGDSDGSIEYSPAYITSTHTSIMNGGTAAQGINFQLFGALTFLVFISVCRYKFTIN